MPVLAVRPGGYPYGVARAGTPGTLPTDYAFTGQRHEEPLGGLYHMGARFYDPALGRWLNADPLVPDLATPHSLNRYGYTLNNPLEYLVMELVVSSSP